MSWDGALQAHAVMSTQAGHEEDIKLVRSSTSLHTSDKQMR